MSTLINFKKIIDETCGIKLVCWIKKKRVIINIVKKEYNLDSIWKKPCFDIGIIAVVSSISKYYPLSYLTILHP